MLFQAIIDFYFVNIQALNGKCKNAISGPNQRLLGHYPGLDWKIYICYFRPQSSFIWSLLRPYLEM